MVGLMSIIFIFLIISYYIFLIFFEKMENSKISFRKIITSLNYIKNSSEESTLQDKLIFFILPLILSGLLIYGIGVSIDIKGTNNSVITIITIVSAILLNFWTILISIDHERKDLIGKVSENIVLNIFITVIMMVLTLCYRFEIHDISCQNIIIVFMSGKEVQKIMTFLYLYLIIFYILNFLMIIQRFYLMTNKNN